MTIDFLPNRRPRSETGTVDIAILVFPGVQLLDVTGPAQVFASASEILAPAIAPAYRVSVVSPKGGLVRTSSGIALKTAPFTAASRMSFDTLVCAGGPGVQAASRDRALMAWIADRQAQARRVCSVCTGVFLLAEAGLLDGRRATTHWHAVDALRQRYPDIRVERDPIFVRDGRFWTSAGVTAGIDMALALVDDDRGRKVALQVARRLVVFLKRPGGQSQYSARLSLQSGEGDEFDSLHDWIAGNLAADLRVERLAAFVGMSPRNFARRYTEVVGYTPARAVEAMRIEAARAALEDSNAHIATIARRCGFGNEFRMRGAFARALGVSPRSYRERFSTVAGRRR